MACINVQITTDLIEATPDEIFEMLDRLHAYVKDDKLPFLSMSADWIDEESGDINYFTP